MRTTWKKLLGEGRVRPHTTSAAEMVALRSIVERDLADAAVPELSCDRRFATAYNAILNMARMVIGCAGFRTIGLGHHQTTFEALEAAMGGAILDDIAYFDLCRRKRNMVDYDMRNVASETEAAEIMIRAAAFREFVETWIKENHPEYGLSDPST